ncbi:MAG TPA: hypothetical protein VK569_07985 [Bacteroidota bacterium]|nr:hypothetical protein [Bacteroidota bacterium]
MMRYRQYTRSAGWIASGLAVLLASVMPARAQVEVRWMAVGSLNHWFAATGHEIEEGRVAVQQDGLQWPAYYKYQDVEAASGLWIGALNWKDATGKTWLQKVVHVGPRVNGLGEFFPVNFKTVSRFAPPTVLADGNPTTGGAPLSSTTIDPSLKCDRMIINTANTALGVTMTRKILAWCQTYNDNYFIYEYTFTNTGQIDATTNAPLAGQTLNGLYVFIQSRYACTYDGSQEIGNPTSWGINSMNDARGDGVKPDPVGQQFRCRYTWQGLFPTFTAYDNLGAPMFHPAQPASDPGDTTGRLAAAQFVGTVTLHADKSATDTTDDPTQPATTTYFGSDEPNFPPTSRNSQFDVTFMANEYTVMSSGHTSPRHADKVQTNGAFDTPSGDPSLGTSGGFSNADGYGPYTLAPGQSIHIVCAEGVAGLGRAACLSVGRAFKAAGGGVGTPAAKAKNDSVLTGRDSLFQTFRRATANYKSGYAIPQPPLPPKMFSATSAGDGVNLAWDVYGSDPLLQGFQIYRARDRSDGTYSLVASLAPSVRTYKDTALSRGYDYYYYMVSVGSVVASDPTGSTPAGALLTSNRIMSQTYDKVNLLRQSVETTQPPIRIVPNPFSIASDISKLRFGSTVGDRIAFFNIPGQCKIRIYTEVGELIQEILHTNGSGDEYWNSNTSSGQVIVSGVYIVIFENLKTGERTIRKLAVIR